MATQAVVSERISARCGTQDNYTWIETSTLYVSAYSAQVHTIQKSPSALSCIENCEEQHKHCTAIVYDDTNKQCLWYEEPQMQNYQRLDLASSKRGLFKTCAPGKVLLSEGYSLNCCRFIGFVTTVVQQNVELDFMTR